MSLMALAWAAIFVTTFILSFRRPAYAVAMYMATFFAAPHLWWWGRDLPRLRYGVIAGLTLLVVVLIRRTQSRPDGETGDRRVRIAAIAMAANATFVNFAVASNPAISVDNYIELLKFVLLFFLISAAIRTRADLRVAIVAMAIGAGYIGYEATVNDRGTFTHSRLEGIGAPAADTSNSLASVLMVVLPLAGSLFVEGNRRDKLTAIICAPLILNVILLCNSRGAFLGLIGAGATVVVLARGPTRTRALKALALGVVALYLLLGDPKILERFSTTFVGSEQRDASAAGRIVFWRAGLMMLEDYPLGDGGGSFKFIHGATYIARAGGEDAIDRSIHNGYLTEATEWGIQGLLLRLIFIWGACAYAHRTNVRCRKEGRANDALVGICLIASLAGFLIGSVFGSFISNEWSYWIIALLVRYGQLYQQPALAAAPVQPRVEPVSLLPRFAATSKAG